MTAPWLLERPESPSQWDDEFESDVMDPKWTLLGPNPYVHVDYLDPYSAFSSGDEKQSLNRQRKSWWMFQPVASGGHSRGISQAVSLPAECFIYLRGCISTRRASASDQDGEISVRLVDAGGTNQVLSMMDSFGGIVGAIFSRTVNGSYLNLGLLKNYLGEAFPVEYVAIQKLNNTYHGWAAPSSGNWVWMGSYTHVVALTELWVGVGNTVTSAPGNLIVGTDFLRVIPGRKLP